MPDKRRIEVVRALDDERLADVLQEMEEDDQVELLRALEDERAADVLEAMDDDDAADLLGELPTADQQRLLELMEPEDAEPVRRLMTYADYTAGGMMTSEPVVLLPDATVAEALALVRNPGAVPGDRRPGVRRAAAAGDTDRQVPRHRAPAAAAARAAVGAGQRVCEKDTGALRADTTLEDVTRHLATYNLVAAPVVDDHDRLLGAVSVDDVLDHLLPEGWRDADRSAVNG